MANIRHRYRYTKAQTGVVLLLALVLSGAPSWPAWAQPGASEDDRNKKVEQLSAEGAKLFKAGKYPEAIDRFEKAYAIIPVANLLYNIAFAYDRTGDIEKAVAYYERFILAKDADPEIRSRALNRITEIREELAKLDAIKDNAGSGSTGNPNPTPKQEEGLSSMATTGIVVGGVGVAMVATGAIFGLLASSDEQSFSDTQNASEKSDFQDSAETKALTADILYGLGGAALIAGVTMVILGTGSEENPNAAQETTWQWGPGPGQVGVGVTIPWGE